MADRNYNIALNASDGFSGAFRNLVSQISAAEGAASKLGGVMRNLGALSGAVGVGMFAGMLREVIQAGAELNNLAKTTSLTVEQLSTISDVARQSGTSMEQVTGAIIKFQKALDNAREGSKEASLAFRMLGIDANDGTLKTANGLDLVATRMLQMEDGVLKNNIAMQLFGRTGAELNEFLSDYATRTEKAARISTEMAENNEKLERGWRALKNAIGDAVTTLGQWIAKGAGKLMDINARDALDQVLERQKALRNEIERLSDPSTLSAYEQIYAPAKLEKARADLAKLNAAQIDLNKQLGIISYTAADADQNSRKLFQGLVLGSDKAGTAAKYVNTHFDEMQRIFKQLDEELKTSTKFWDDLAKAQEDAAKAAGKYAAAQADAMEQDASEREKSIRNIFEQVNALEREVEQLELSNIERERSAALLALESSGLDINSDAYKDLAARINEAYDAKKRFGENQDALRANANAAKAAADEWQRTAESISNSLTDALLRGFESGKDFAKNLRDTLVNMFKTLVLRPIIQAVLAPIAGGLGGLFGGTANASSGAAGILGGGGDWLSGIGNWIAGLGGGGGGFLGGFGGGLTNFGVQGLFGGMGMNFSGGIAALGAGNILGGLGSLAAGALPIIGIGMAIASALGLFDRGGPKVGGSASATADIGLGTVAPGGMDRLFTPDQRDAAMQTIATQVANDYMTIARSLGLSTGAASFGFGFDTDPEGTAGNRVSARAIVNGQQVYGVTDRDLGREGDYNAALAEEASRALLAALQASSLPDYLANLFNTLDVETATPEQINALVQTAAALRIAVDALAGLGDQFAAMDPADVREFVESFGGLEQFMQRFAYIADNFYTDAQKLEKATEALSAGFADLGIQVPDTHQAFLDLLNGLDLTTEEGRELYEAISALAPLFVQVNGTAQQAVDGMDELVDELEEVASAANTIDLGRIGATARTEFERIMDNIDSLVGNVGGSLGDQLSLRIQFINGEIARLTAALGTVWPGGDEWQAIDETIAHLRWALNATTGELARFTVLAAQYDAGRASELVALERWYGQQQALFAGNAEALAALRDIFQDRWQDIIDGVGGGVNGTLEELERLRQSLRDYLADLTLRSDLSPLSPAARLAEAQTRYQDLLRRAQGGDVEALRDIQSAADAYLRLARDMFASGSGYTTIFDQVVRALTALANPPRTGGPDPAFQHMADAMPTGSPIASQEDVERMALAIIGAIRDGATTQAIATTRSAERVAVATRPLK